MGDFVVMVALYPRYSAHQPSLELASSPKVVGLMQPASSMTHHGYVNYAAPPP